MLTVKILGPGCANCKRLEQETREALTTAALSFDYEIVKVTDYAAIAAYGVMTTPALVFNDKVVAIGRIPKREQIAGWAREFAVKA